MGDKMKKLAYLTGELTTEVLSGTEVADRNISAVVYDSRKVVPGCLFLCIKGAKYDGHDALEEVLEKGAGAVLVCDKDKAGKYVEAAREKGVLLIYTPDTRYALGVVAAAWFDHPARKLTTIGVTGTKGKTTTTYLIREILRHAGISCGLIGTIEADTCGRCIPSVNTTPESYLVQEYFAEMVENGAKAVVMEVSSQGLMLHRVAGFTFDYGIFTNLSPDHIGPAEHKDFADYLHCKSLLFQQCKVGLVNADDEHAKAVLEGHTCEVETFGMGEGADLQAKDLELCDLGSHLGIRFQATGILDMKVEAPFPGRFSAYNVMSALLVCHHFAITPEDIRVALSKTFVKGRIEMLPVSGDFTVMIDYAHNGVSLKSILETLREYEPGRIVSLFGCGGNRAKDRRYDMGEVSGKYSDLTIVTSDNPRDEEPMDIIADIVTGVERTGGEYVTIPDRKEAIAYALHHAEPGDVIVLAGKGHEDYQEIKGVKHHMDERELVWQVLKEDGKTEAAERIRERYSL